MAKLRTVEAMQQKLNEAQAANAKHKAANAELRKQVALQALQLDDLKHDLVVAKGAALSQVEG